MINTPSLIIGILGFIVTLVGSYFSYISFVNPKKRFNKYLKKPENWEKFFGIENNLYIYRYKKYPNFQIVINWNHELVENFHEEWINDDIFPDKTNNASYYVRLEANSMLLDKEVFVSLDGHRYFVPVPKILSSNENKRVFYYDNQQVQLSKIVGVYHSERDIYEFIKNCKKPILIKD